MKLPQAPLRKKGEIYSEVTAHVLAALKRGPGTAATLSLAMKELDGWRDDAKHARLRRVLYKLSLRDQAHRRIVDGRLVWCYGAEGFAGAADFCSAPVVPPRQYDVMGAPAYRAGSGPALRPGALDHKRWGSVGVRC